MSTKIKNNVVVLAKANTKEDLAFYSLLLKPDSYLRNKATVYMFLSVEDLNYFLIQVKPEFKFYLFVHVGGNSMNPDVDGQEFTMELKKLSYHNKLNYYYTSRQGIGDFLGSKILYTLELCYEEFSFKEFKINIVSDLIDGTKPDQLVHKELGKNDFAILTALYKDEHEAFSSNMSVKKILGEKNLVIGKFNASKKMKNDYQKEILLSWQQDMGSIDAAAFSSSIITKYNPKFLILAGVCGGRKDEVNIYDVIIPKNIHDYMSGKFKNGVFIPRPLRAEPNQELIGHIEYNSDKIIDSMRKIAPLNLKAILDGNFKIHFKNYASGPWVIKTNKTMLNIAQNSDDDIIGLEMESLGVVRAGNLFSKYSQYSLVVKSVMDFTDENKTDGEKGMIKTNASIISYLCIRAMLPLLLEFKDTKL